MSAAVFKAAAIFVWSRNKWAFFVLVAVYALLLLRSMWVDADIATLSGIATILLLAPAFAPGAIFGSGAVATADLLSPESTFPKQFFNLPATARQLVLPFILGAAALSAILSVLAIVISDGKLNLLVTHGSWLPFLSMSFTVWGLVLTWVPVRRRFTRIAQGLGPIAVHVAVLVYALNGTLSREVVIAFSLLQLPLAYAVAVRGVARARCGEPGPLVESRDAVAAPEKTSSRTMPELTSPQHAIFWMERQMHRWVGKSALIALLPALLIVIIVLQRLGGAAERDVEGLQTLGGIAITLLVLTTVIVGISTGLNVASFRPRMRSNEGEAFQITSFFAALPLGSDDFVWAKFKAGLTNMLWVIGVSLAVGLVIAHVSALTDRWEAQYAAWTEAYGAATALMRFVLPLAVLLLFVLSLTVSVMWIGLRGRGWTVAFGLINVVVVIVMLASLALSRRYPGLIRDWLPETLWVVAALKVCVLTMLILRVQSRRLLGQGRLVAILGFWGATVAAILSYCAIWLPEVTTITALCAGLVLAPVLGTVGAPLAMARNRAG